MSLKSVSIVLIGLTLCCFLQGAAAQDDVCQLKLWYGPTIPDTYIVTSAGEGDFKAPFKGWFMMNGNYNATSYMLIRAWSVEKLSSYCDYCVMTAYNGNTYNGTSQVIDFRTRVGNNTRVSWDFRAYSYTLDCFPPGSEEEEEESQEEIEYEEAEEEEEESQEEIEYEEAEEEEEESQEEESTEEAEEEESQEEEEEEEEEESWWPEEEEEEEEEDRSGEYVDAVFQPMNEGDGETLPHELVELRHKNVQSAINRLVSKKILPAGKYTTEKVYSTELATNYDEIHRFNVKIRDESGVEYRIWFIVLSYTEDHEVYQVADAGLKENRSSEFPHTDFKVLPVVEESQEPYPAEVEDLGTKSVNQAVVKLQANGILPKGTSSNFIGFYTFNLIEYSSIVNMTEYPDHDDILYRFNARVIDQSGAIFRVWTIVAINYETPEYYELIDFGFKQSRLAEFTDTDWREMNEGEGMPLPEDIVQMRTRSVAQAIPKLQAEGTLPAGKYTIANTYATEFSFGFVNENWPYFTSQPTDGLYRFNVQLSNEAGAKFRVAVVVITNYDIQPKYELIDYSFVENRLDEFTNIKFISLDQTNLQTKSINEAVDRLISKDALPSGKYTIVKNYPTEFSSKFEHPDYSSDQYLLFQFTADVENAAKVEYKVYAIVITQYDNLQDYELIDYGRTQ